MQVTCPTCGGAIGADDVNVSKDVAMCRACNQVFAFSSLTGSGAAAASQESQVDLDDPPPGCRFEWRPSGFTVSGSTRSWLALMLIPFAIGWWSFLSFFVGAILMGKINNSGEGAAEEAAEGSGLPVAFMLLFMTPFFAAGLGMIAQVLVLLFGRTEVTVEGNEACVFTGFGLIGRRKRFDWGGVTRIQEQTPPTSMPMQMPMSGGIVLEGKDRIVLGRLLNESRRYFVAAALKRMLVERQG
jgi:hypothetical protein